MNKLGEGWDVTNLYTIVPLRAASAPRLIEQTIGRGLRLPYGKRTGVAAVDRLSIIAHDKFQEIIDEASRPGSVIKLQQIIVQKFQSDSERRLAVILERDSDKWFKPAKGQFQIFYKQGADHAEYQPDFVAETEKTIYMLEPKAKNEMEDVMVLAKKEVAEKWCTNASNYAAQHGGEPWKYALIPHDAITENMTLEGLCDRWVR